MGTGKPIHLSHSLGWRHETQMSFPQFGMGTATLKYYSQHLNFFSLKILQPLYTISFVIGVYHHFLLMPLFTIFPCFSQLFYMFTAFHHFHLFVTVLHHFLYTVLNGFKTFFHWFSLFYTGFQCFPPFFFQFLFLSEFVTVFIVFTQF